MRWLLALLALCFSATAFGWWNDEWTQRKQITINTTATGANTQAALNDMPVLVRLHSGNFPQFLNLLDRGADFRFLNSDDLTPLKFHVERFDAVAELAYVWVKVPVVSPQSDKGSVYLYFGNQAAPQAEDSGGTFDVNTVAAFHFGESDGLPADSTAYKTAVTSGKVFPLPASHIGTGATLSGTEPLVLGAAPHLQLNPAAGWTFETWVRLNGLPVEPAYLLDRRGAGGAGLSVTISATALEARIGEAVASSPTPLTTASWHHVAVVVLADGLQLFVDGAQVGAVQTVPPALDGPIHIGGAAAGGGLLAADIDELRISNVARGADWIAFSTKVQGSANDRVLGYGLDDTADGGSKAKGSFGIIFQNVFGKPEAWVEQSVIILCGLMMLAAAVIMFLKTVTLSRAARASKRFLVAYGNLGQQRDAREDLDSLYGARQQYRDSPLWRVYHVGIDEIHKRVSPAVGAGFAGLETKALAAVRAAMDALMVRENQRLNSQLVLLTIAISGGPFIGLFGTVVGVMVTFAAIAATGDVNIAAIAPGMAAALLATVAGLGVAIPSLFGYNWLSTRAKEQVADMRVFADELEARFAELYGR
jgi:biopolymer transport protein ExbB